MNNKKQNPFDVAQDNECSSVSLLLAVMGPELKK